jgi:hypothetical protein
MTDPTLTWLCDVEALRQLPQRYARAIDARDIDTVGLLFDPEGSVDGVRGSAPVPAYLDTLRAMPASGTTMHVLGDPLIELEVGADEAHLDTYAVVHQLRPADSPDPDAMLGMRYLDHVVRRGDAWLIHHRRSTMPWSRPLPK